ncbi:neuronal PAS domain-containing protein 4-like [Danio aesculapii]|uniref:neuronal PAS domain-containing protein 4-like n=1 Tax=Danio aesculapii TaxID=1142201 RepID=UPI0024C0E2FE|nr:neuronal PAS domain-containing protein 4-like [Danio aesculapii]XP_056326958.1 neuronal PAS domain-containing protein 4-like [Danio aesculapii]
MSCGDPGIRRILRASKRFRSTKGASKARRDQMNSEIRSLRALLPISPEHRLSYLHSMSITCTYFRKSVELRGVCDATVSAVCEESTGVSAVNKCVLQECVPQECVSQECVLQECVPQECVLQECVPQECVLQALPGFIVAFTADGKLLYVSENVHEYLGLSMVDVLQSDSFFDMLDRSDVEALRNVLADAGPSAERSVVCRMLVSKALRLRSSCCPLLVRLRLRDGVCVSLCRPTADRLPAHDADFHTHHSADMRFTSASSSVLFHLGFSAEELIGRSWYELLHPDDLRHAADRHATLLTAADAEMLIRVQCKDLTWVWMYTHASATAERDAISSCNYIISAAEAVYLQQRLSSSSSSSSSASPQCSSVSDSSDAHSTHTLFCTPPYSPTSSQCSDFLSEGYGALEALVDSAFCSPPYPPLFPNPCCAPAVCPPDAALVPAALCPPNAALVPTLLCPPDTALAPARLCPPEAVLDSARLCPLDTALVPARLCPLDAVLDSAQLCPPDAALAPAQLCPLDTALVPARLCPPDAVLDSAQLCPPDAALTPAQLCPLDTALVPAQLCPPDAALAPAQLCPLDTALVPARLFPLDAVLDSAQLCPPNAALVPTALCPPDAALVPVCRPLQAFECPLDGAVSLEDLSMFPLPQDGGSRLMPPEASPAADTHFPHNVAQQAEIGTLALQIHTLIRSFDAYSGAQHTHPHHTPCWAPEPLLDEGIIDSILRELDSRHTHTLMHTH